MKLDVDGMAGVTYETQPVGHVIVENQDGDTVTSLIAGDEYASAIVYLDREAVMILILALAAAIAPRP